MSERQTHFLVIGSGVSGLIFALKAAKLGTVTVISKAKKSDSATQYAQGGIAAAIGELDLPTSHIDDTLDAGAGLCDRRAVEILVKEGIERVEELIKQGMQFTLDDGGKIHLGREGGHSQHRILHSDDFTGMALEDFLLGQVSREDNIEILEHHFAVDLITEHQITGSIDPNDINCYGAYVLDLTTNEVITIVANYTCLAAGGAGQVYPFTTNPDVSTGDGIAMAYLAGCKIRNLEFVQFHPTALYQQNPSENARAFLITEAMRGFGAKLKLQNGEPFMQNHSDQLELAPRDIVAHAIDYELKKRGDDHVLLDVIHKDPEEIKKHFPNIYERLLEKNGIDITKEAIPVIPACHYICGGVKVNYNGLSDINFLYVVGESASTGVHGGNRLASNSLLEGLVFSHRAVDDAQVCISENQHEEKKYADKIPRWSKEGTENIDEWILIKHDREAAKKLLWDYVGIVRTTKRLEIALRRIDHIYEMVKEFYSRTEISKELVELRNQVLVSQLIVRSALSRKESRGLHYSTDFTENREPSRSDTILQRASLRK